MISVWQKYFIPFLESQKLAIIEITEKKCLLMCVPTVASAWINFNKMLHIVSWVPNLGQIQNESYFKSQTSTTILRAHIDPKQKENHIIEKTSFSYSICCIKFLTTSLTQDQKTFVFTLQTKLLSDLWILENLTTLLAFQEWQ